MEDVVGLLAQRTNSTTKADLLLEYRLLNHLLQVIMRMMVVLMAI